MHYMIKGESVPEGKLFGIITLLILTGRELGFYHTDSVLIIKLNKCISKFYTIYM